MKEVNDALIETLAGEAAFKRGLAYFREGRVGSLRQHRNTITADVEGTSTWQVTLKHTAAVFEGTCDCPASDHFDFCKHCVATALKYSRHLGKLGRLRESNATNRLPAYLMTLDKKELADSLLELLESDRQLLNRWKMKADVAAGKMDIRAIKKQITAAIPYNRNLYRYRQVRVYFAGIEDMLQELLPLIEKLEPEKALTLVDYAIARIDRALESVDDSGGFRLQVLETLGALHLQTLQRSSYNSKQLSDYLYELYFKPQYELYPAIPGEYDGLLGDEGRAHFLQLIKSDWDALPKLKSGGWNAKYHYLRLQWPLLDQAIKEKDIETEIELRAKTAVDSGDFLSISRLCLQNNLLDQAIDWHNRATNSDSRAHGWQLQIENNQIQIWLGQNKQAEVLQLLWQRFEKSFAVPVYKHIVEVSCDTSDETDNFARAAAVLQKEIDSSNQIRSQKATDALANLHIFHQQFEEALLMAEQGTLDPHLLLEISRANRQFPERILPLLFRVADYHVRQGRNDEYRQAIEIIKEAHEIAGRDHQQQFAVQLSRIQLTHKPKRNFQKWLGEAFSQLL